MSVTSQAPLVILDRDGVINYERDDYIKSPDEWVPLPGSVEAIVRLRQAGFRVAVATNQSGVERGLFSLTTLLTQFRPSRAWMVGDSLRDLQAAERANLPSLLVKTGRGRETLQKIAHPNGFENLEAAAQWLISTQKSVQ